MSTRQTLLRDGATSVGPESVGDFDAEFAEAVATERYVALGGQFARQRHDQGTRGGCDDRWSAAARAIVESIAALGQKASSASDGPWFDSCALAEPGRGSPTQPHCPGSVGLDAPDVVASCQPAPRRSTG